MRTPREVLARKHGRPVPGNEDRRPGGGQISGRCETASMTVANWNVEWATPGSWSRRDEDPATDRHGKPRGASEEVSRESDIRLLAGMSTAPGNSTQRTKGARNPDPRSGLDRRPLIRGRVTTGDVVCCLGTPVQKIDARACNLLRSKGR